MYNVSQNFLNKVYTDDTRHLLKVYIDEIEVEGKYILGFSRDYNLFDDEFIFGSTPSAQIELKIHKDGLPTTYNTIRIETGIDDEIIPLGTYQLEEIKKDDNYTVTITAMDYMIKFEKNYDGSKLTYPATLKTVLNDICNKIGVELGSTSFLNDDKQIAVYDNTVTARTYISYISECAGGFAYIGYDNKLYIKTIENGSVEEIPFRLFQNYTWGDEFKISRIAYEDGIQDFKVGTEDFNTVWINSDNMYVIDKEQIERIFNIYNQFNVYSFSGTCLINPALELGDIVLVDGKKIIYQGKIEYKGKFKADISSDIQTKTKEDCMVTRISDNVKIRRVQSSIDQVEGEITTLVEEVDGQNSKISQVTQTVDELNSKIQDIADITVKEESTFGKVEFTNINQSEPIDIQIHSIGVNISYLYPADNLYPSDDLFMTDRVLQFTNTKTNEIFKYTLPDDLLYYDSDNYDEFILNYDSGTCQVIKRCKYNSDGSIGLLENATYIDYEYPSIQLTDGDYKIELLGYESAYIMVRLMASNIYTTQFATKAEVSSQISQTAQQIETEVSEKYTLKDTTTELSSRVNQTSQNITAEVNRAINAENSINGKIELKIDKNDINQVISMINAVANLITIHSDYFDLSADGHITATGGTIGGFNISDNVLEGESAGFSSNEYYAFWARTPDVDKNFFVTWNGDIYCKSLLVGDYGVVRTLTDTGRMVTTHYIDGNQIIDTTANAMYVTLPDSIISDEKKKKNIKPTDINGLDIISKMNFVQFDWRDREEHEKLGVIAQEVEKIDETLAQDITFNEETTKVFNQSRMILINSKAIQELHEENKQLKEQINNIFKRLEVLENG